MLKIQWILINRNKFTRLQAIAWIIKHGYKIKKVDITENFYRFRQLEPNWKYYITKKISSGIEFVMMP